jgi:PadR family transcriptional regulator PadR
MLNTPTISRRRANAEGKFFKLKAMTVESLKNVDNVKAQMRKGILEYCILSILSRGDSYAPQIISELKEADMIVVEGTLYPLLARQKNQGLLSYRWEESPQGPPRKYYMITDSGREILDELDGVWEEMVSQIRAIRYGSTPSSAVENNE